MSEPEHGADTVTDLGTDQDVPCFDPECAEQGGLAEPEQDGDWRYYACQRCGYEFGYAQVAVPQMTQEHCSIGVPESVRRKASKPFEDALRAAEAQQPVPLTLKMGPPR